MSLPYGRLLHPRPALTNLQVMQNAALRTATGCTQDTNIQHLQDETLTLPIHEHIQFHTSQFKWKTTFITSSTQTYNILQHKKTLTLTMASTQQTFPQTTTPSIQQTCTIYIHLLSIHHHYAPYVTPTHATHTISSTAPTYVPHCPHWICGHTLLKTFYTRT